MLIIPAIDLKNGKCVRLEQGVMEKETLFSHHPREIARQWEALGAEMLHLVDLDGAFSGIPQNKVVIQEIRQAVTIPIQLGGGIRTLDVIEQYLSMGINRVILGTIAYQQKAFLSEACLQFPDRIVVGIDARNGKVAIKGWAEQTDFSAIELARRCEHEGAAAIIYTDILRDGMLTGVNLSATRMVAQAVSIPIIASGGVATIEDIRKLMPLTNDGVRGIIIGRALYEEKIDLKEAIWVAKGQVC
ncbi:MAG: 1-(5-phosphoribosyl)-5-[(5-phosphoribosylamino)methylideneamino]imidazole-4-carboxamide isomerase [Pseudomonadota bacterium]